ncbi:hypothetical protein LY78DRAFT_90073 [Colletotrichum sublineola]|nr:hypothetical protein LY78DRAFT_90073 [Colletotrichum sublineola]
MPHSPVPWASHPPPGTCTAPAGTSHTTPPPSHRSSLSFLLSEPDMVQVSEAKWMEPKLKEKCFPSPDQMQSSHHYPDSASQTYRQTDISKSVSRSKKKLDHSITSQTLSLSLSLSLSLPQFPCLKYPYPKPGRHSPSQTKQASPGIPAPTITITSNRPPISL